MLDMKQRIALTKVIRLRYQKSSKKEKTRIISELVANTGYNRSYARHILGTLKKKGGKKKYASRKRLYDASVFYPLRKLWTVADGICGQRLKPFLPELIRVLEREGDFKEKKIVKEKLLRISSATIDRVLSAAKKSYQC